ncbi:MAG: phosphatidylglycerol lysyltransferase domain-containing protein [Emergencia sp.]|nr:phosphatidylglycerol lysyltransferase domain-containing protein [Emergencia sp.]
MNIFKHCFEDMTEEEIKTLKEYFTGFDYRGAGYTFLANYIWRNTHCLCWEVIDDYLFLAGADCMIGEPSAVISMPMTKNGIYEPEKLRAAVNEARSRFAKRKIPFSIILVPGHMRQYLEEAFPGEMSFEHDRDSDEYIYLKEKLITLSGRALHKKKNHLNYFLKTYSYEVRPIDKTMLPEIMELVRDVKEGKDYDADELESLHMEEEAISEVLKFAGDQNVYGTAVFIDGKIEAFAIGELLSEDTAVEHFEKANDKFRGLYQLVCSEFCKSLPERVEYVNREEDMGLENLRHAKEALKPNHMEEKYTACFL